MENLLIKNILNVLNEKNKILIFKPNYLIKIEQK